jgi:hypothetical protein
MSFQYESAKRFARLCRNRKKETLVALGGRLSAQSAGTAGRPGAGEAAGPRLPGFRFVFVACFGEVEDRQQMVR